MHKKIIACLMFVLAMLFTLTAYAAEVTDVRWGLDRFNVLRLVVDLDAPPVYDISFEENTMLISVDAALNEKVTRSFTMRSQLAKTMTVEAAEGKTVLRLPLARAIGPDGYNSFTLKQDPATKRPNRLVVDITADKSSTPIAVPTAATIAKAEQDAKPAAAAGTISADAAKPAITSRPAAAAAAENAGAKTATVPNSTAPKTEANVTIPKATAPKAEAQKADEKAAKDEDKKENKKKEDKKKDDKKETKAKKVNFKTDGGIKGKKITLDAGHGGSDPGAIGANGTMEKDVTLKITKKVQELLKKEGAKVSMTRTGDKDVYGPRATDAQELQARVDVAEDNDADLFISIHINSSTNKKVGGFSSYYYPKTKHDARIAQAIQDRLVKNFKLDDLGIRQANFYVNKRCTMPSTLLELGFISNAQEEKLMHSNWYINKLAKSIADGIKDYFK